MKIGDTFLVGINYYNHKDEWSRSDQVFGEITSILENSISLKCQASGEEKSFPNMEEAIEPGDGGAYQFGEDAVPVINPTFVATYKVKLAE